MSQFELSSFKEDTSYKLYGRIERSFNNIWLSYVLEGDIEEVVIPNQKALPERKDGLWENTCFELFMADPKTTRYCEFNISPSGDWNVFEFSEYRGDKTEVHDVFSPSVERTKESSNKIKFLFNIPLFNEVKFFSKIGLSAVIKESENTHFWALSHPREVPDFHDIRSFSLEIPHSPQ